jgi:very-short-patch-repair endonuclease
MLAGPATTVKRARKLRLSMSVPEVILWSRLRLRPAGFKYRRQHPAGRYVLDFFCSEAQLAIEVDGIGHDMGNRPASDAAREQWLAAQGVAVLRIAASDVVRNAEAILETIVSACSARANPLHQPSAGPPPRSGEETAHSPSKGTTR